MSADFFTTDANRTIDAFPSRPAHYQMPEVISRKEFLEEFKHDYKPGQHVTTIGPTQRGKSRLTKEMAKVVISPALKVIVFLGKPPHRERTWTEDTADELRLRVTDVWPPRSPKSFLSHIKRQGNLGRSRDINGYLLRPHHTMSDLDADNRNMYVQFKAAMLHAYGSVKQKYIILIDEGHHTQVDLGLKHVCEAPLMRGAPDCGEWTNLQRSRHVSYLVYDAPEHVLTFKDKDTSNQDRLGEIGGIDARYMRHITNNLRTERVPSGGTISQAAYFRRASDDIRVIDT